MLAGLRAHYPEHQHKKKKEERRGEARRSEEKKTEKTSDETTHTFTHRLSARSNHHRYSTMTQPCHKNTTLNQQCCDSKHKEKGGQKNKTRSTHHRTSPPTTHTATQDRSEDEDNVKGGQDNARCRTQSEEDGETVRNGEHHTPYTTALQRGPPTKRQGDADTKQGGRQHTAGRINDTAALHSPRHPPSAMPPTTQRCPHHHHDEGGADRGYPTAQRPRTDTHPHTTAHLATRQQHDMTAVLTAMHWTRQDTERTTAPG